MRVTATFLFLFVFLLGTGLTTGWAKDKDRGHYKKRSYVTHQSDHHGKRVSRKRGGRSHYVESRRYDRGHSYSHRKAHKRAQRRHRRLHRRSYRRHGHYHGDYFYENVYHDGCNHYRVYGHHDFRHGHHGDRHHRRHRGRIVIGISIPF